MYCGYSRCGRIIQLINYKYYLSEITNNKGTNKPVTLAISIKQISEISSYISNLSLEYTDNLQLSVKLALPMVVLHTAVKKHHRPKLKTNKQTTKKVNYEWSAEKKWFFSSGYLIVVLFSNYAH